MSANEHGSQDKKYNEILPWRQVLSLSSANFSQAVMLTTPFTIAVFMVRDFLAAKRGGSDEAVDEQLVGQLTGLLAGIFSFSSFLTAYAWGCASNYIGRKPVLLVGHTVSFVSILWFGLSGSYGTALAARAFGGFFNGILGAWKCMIGESTAVLLQGKFFGYMSLAWGLGCIAGPALGGALSRPCSRAPHLALCGETGLLRKRPYFLACAVGSLTILAAFLLSVLLLEETLPAAMRAKGLGAAIRRKIQRRRRERRRLLKHTQQQQLEDGGEEADEESDASSCVPKVPRPRTVAEPTAEDRRQISRWWRPRRRTQQSVEAAAPTGDLGIVHAGSEAEEKSGDPVTGTSRGEATGERTSLLPPASGERSDGPPTSPGQHRQAWCFPRPCLPFPSRARTCPSVANRQHQPHEPGLPLVQPAETNSVVVSELSDGAASADPWDATEDEERHSPCGSAAHHGEAPTRTPSLARLQGLLRLASRTYIDFNPFRRSGSLRGQREAASARQSAPGEARPMLAAGEDGDAADQDVCDHPGGSSRQKTGAVSQAVRISVADDDSQGDMDSDQGGLLRERRAGGARDEAKGKVTSDLIRARSWTPGADCEMGLPGGGVSGGVRSGGGVSDHHDDDSGDRSRVDDENVSPSCRPLRPGPCRPNGTTSAAGARLPPPPPEQSTFSGDDLPTTAAAPCPSAASASLQLTQQRLQRRHAGMEAIAGREFTGGALAQPVQGQESGEQAPSENPGTLSVGDGSSGGSGISGSTSSSCGNSTSGSLMASPVDDGAGTPQPPTSPSRHHRPAPELPVTEQVPQNLAPALRHHQHQHQESTQQPAPVSSSNNKDSEYAVWFVWHGRRSEAASRAGSGDGAGAAAGGCHALEPLPEDASLHGGGAVFWDVGDGLDRGSGQRRGEGAPVGQDPAAAEQQLRGLPGQAWSGAGAAESSWEAPTARGSCRAEQGGHPGKQVAAKGESVETAMVAVSEGEKPQQPTPWIRCPQVVQTVLGYGAVSLIFCALDEVFPIFAAAPRSSGGLGMSEDKLAPPLMFYGVVLMPYSLYGYPPLQRRIGTLRLTIIGLVVAALVCFSIPSVANVWSASEVCAQVLLYGTMVFKAFAQCSAFTGSIIAVNAAPAQEQLGAVNGVGQTLAALVRGVGPALGGVLWSVSLGLHSTGQQFLTFAIIAGVAAATCGLYASVRLPGMR